VRYVQLRAFHYVAVHGGFSRAAEALFLTQPAVSDQVRKLEEEYDVLLFSRRHKRPSLTPAGEELFAITRKLFDCEAQAHDFLAENHALRSGKLRIVADSASHLVAALARFRAQYPDVSVSVSSGNSESVISRLRDYNADVGVLADVPPGREFRALHLNSAPIVAVAPTSHPVAGRASLTLADLVGLPLILREKGSRTRLMLEEAIRRQGLALPPAIEVEGREAVRELVASGAGVGVVSSAEFMADDRCTRVAIEGEGLMMQEALVCLRARSGSKLIGAFFAAAEATLGD